MTDERISHLFQRMRYDMAIRRIGEKTQNDYLRQVKAFTAFVGRSPDMAIAEDLRLFQLDQRQKHVGVSTINTAVSALRFFFTATLDRPEMGRHLCVTHEPRKIPVVLSPEEVARFIEAARRAESAPLARRIKYKAAFSAAYGAGLRVSEVAALKVSDIDSQRMMIRIEQGKGRKDRYAMLSPRLLHLLRDWWRIARLQGWLFPGQNPINPLSTRQLNRACHMAASLAEIGKRVSPHTSRQRRAFSATRHSFATHLLEQDIDIRVIQVLLGHARLDTTALYTRVATKTIREVMSPLDRLSLLGDGPAAA